MIDWIANLWNCFLGSNETHVFNAYPGSDHVWLHFDTREIVLEQLRLTPGGLFGRSADTSEVSFTGQPVKQKICLPFREHHKQRRTTVYEYMTILAPKGAAESTDDELKICCWNLRIPANRSYIVTSKGQVVESAYGGPLYKDLSGFNHLTDKQEEREPNRVTPVFTYICIGLGIGVIGAATYKALR